MAESWQDLFVRTDVSETSPLNRTGGFGSPDIIPVGTTPADPSSFTTEDSYKRYYNAPLQGGKANFIYVRAKNASATGPNPGKAGLVMTDPAVVLWPGGSDWTRILTQTGSDFSQLRPDPVGPSAIGVTTDPFTFVPPQSGHRCLVTWLSTKQHPAPDPPPRITTAEALATYLKDHPNYAHHNIDIAPNTTGATTRQERFSSGTIVSQWTFGVQCQGCKGFTVSFSSGTQLPNGKFIQLQPITVQQDDLITFTIDSIDIPAGWNTVFNYTYEQNNLLPAKFSVVFAAYHQPLVGSELHARADTADQLRFRRGAVAEDWRGIEVGSIGVMYGSNG